MPSASSSEVVDVVCVGELLIDFMPLQSGQRLADVDSFRRAPGGAPANVAVGIARLGGHSAFMGMIGDDPFGVFLRKTLEENGVDASPLKVTAEARTALAFVSLTAEGERDFMFYRHPSADMLFRPEDVDEATLQRCRAVHFGSISLIGEPERSATLHAVDVARRAGALVSCDPNLRLALWPDADAAQAGLRAAVAAADLVKISDDEVAFLTGSDDPVAGARGLWTDRTKVMVVTRGQAGCVVMTPTEDRPISGFSVPVVDTTGAATRSWPASCRSTWPLPPVPSTTSPLTRGSPVPSVPSPWAGTVPFRRCRPGLR
jgi:fructokinase